MSATQTYNFDSPTDFNQVQTSIAAALASLALTANPSIVFTPTLSSASLSSGAEFTGGLIRQVDTLPDATFAANYNSSIDGNFGGGVLTGTAFGGAAVSGGKLVLTGGTKYVEYAGVGNANNLQVGTVRFRVTPNYTGAPAAIRVFAIQLNTSGDTVDSLHIYHDTDGNLKIIVFGDIGIGHTDSFGTFNPTAGTSYEIEYNYDFTTGAQRMFLDGVLSGSLATTTATRTLGINIIHIGANYVGSTGCDASIDDLAFFSTIQHTAGYTPSYVVNNTKYLDATASGLGFTYSGVGDIQAITAFAATIVNAPKFTLDGKYWSGSAWIASSGTYATANTVADISDNLASLTFSDDIIPIVAYLQASNILQASFTALSVTYTGQKYQSSGYLEPVAAGAIAAASLTSLAAGSATTPANTSIKYGIKVDGTLKYWNGFMWTTSDGTEAQLNPLATVNTNLSSLLLGMNSTIILRIALFTTDTQVTPSIASLTVVYDFGGVLVDPTTCLITGYYLGVDGVGVEGASVTFSLVRTDKVYTEASNAIIEKSVTVLTDANGYFESPLIRSSEFEATKTYKLSIVKEEDGLETSQISSGTNITFTVPDATTKDITDILTQVG